MTTEQYDDLGAEYAEHTASSVINAYYDRPAILALSGDVAGKRVLDVGCAAGHLSARLAGLGATVTGIDSSGVMVRMAEELCNDRDGRPTFRRADLTEPLDFLSDDSFDLVTASLVLHYLKDWGPALAELRRVLRPGGAMVLSVHHPGEDWHWLDRTDYFRTELITDEWTVGGKPRTVRFYRRPLSWTFAALRKAGFEVDQLVEPMPLPECESVDPQWFKRLSTTPRFLYFRLINPSA
ncbi:class I SAM-dependent methyltransferase [Streptomyces roseifaciens]|uniref:class I SAM-dependent methyltransferase n=1 Tax=Streptomyces roseifaciens TaxID=1488406 RepID=UPI000717E966|nr:class I SAM-dependent methyltransferase [Streptomyces roseifaciens]